MVNRLSMEDSSNKENNYRLQRNKRLQIRIFHGSFQFFPSLSWIYNFSFKYQLRIFTERIEIETNCGLTLFFFRDGNYNTSKGQSTNTISGFKSKCIVTNNRIQRSNDIETRGLKQDFNYKQHM